MEHIEWVNYGFYGQRFDSVQRIQRLYNTQGDDWGFKDAAVLAVAYATMMGESGGYLKAFHHNVFRDDQGDKILRYNEDGSVWDGSGPQFMKVKSTDLGFIQKNTPHTPFRLIEMNEEASVGFVDELFITYPKLCIGWDSCKIAWNMYNNAGKKFTPWYAYTNGNYKRGLPGACVAVGRWLANKYLNDPDYVIANPDKL